MGRDGGCGKVVVDVRRCVTGEGGGGEFGVAEGEGGGFGGHGRVSHGRAGAGQGGRAAQAGGVARSRLDVPRRDSARAPVGQRHGAAREAPQAQAGNSRVT